MDALDTIPTKIDLHCHVCEGHEPDRINPRPYRCLACGRPLMTPDTVRKYMNHPMMSTSISKFPVVYCKVKSS